MNKLTAIATQMAKTRPLMNMHEKARSEGDETQLLDGDKRDV